MPDLPRASSGGERSAPAADNKESGMEQIERMGQHLGMEVKASDLIGGVTRLRN